MRLGQVAAKRSLRFDYHMSNARQASGSMAPARLSMFPEEGCRRLQTIVTQLHPNQRP